MKMTAKMSYFQTDSRLLSLEQLHNYYILTLWTYDLYIHMRHSARIVEFQGIFVRVQNE